MEFLTWPWMNLFFKEDEKKYKFDHLTAGLLFIPYGVTVDEFQHSVYQKPQASPEERKQMWREAEKKYLPSRNYQDNEFLESGAFWYRQGHIFGNPFYYIDYTLAQICAYQFWIKHQNNPNKTWEDYYRICQLGGSLPFLSLVEEANLKSPFEVDTIKQIIGPINQWLNGIDDRQL
jgi:M3 family oligoendopeptidase